MTGGAAAATAGSLTLMIGGGAAALDRARPVLDAIAARLFHVGPSGAGHTMKLVHNMICHTIFLATAEGCRAAERAGIPLARAVEVLNAGNARSFVSERRFPDHVISGTFDGRSHVGNLAKDLAMAAALFHGLGQPSAYVTLTSDLLTDAMRLGLGAEDFTRLYLEYDRLAAPHALG
jgi:3-hydroxyisobutyrate dehydrogenase